LIFEACHCLKGCKLSQKDANSVIKEDHQKKIPDSISYGLLFARNWKIIISNTDYVFQKTTEASEMTRRILSYAVDERNIDWWDEWLNLTTGGDYRRIIKYADIRSHQNAFEQNQILNISGRVPFGTLMLAGESSSRPEPLFSVKDLNTTCMNQEASGPERYAMEDLINLGMRPVVVHNEKDGRNYISYFPPFHCSDFRGLFDKSMPEECISMLKCPQDAMVPGFNQIECDVGHALRGAPNKCSLRMPHENVEHTFTLFWIPDETAAMSGIMENDDLETDNMLIAFLLHEGMAFADKGTPDGMWGE